LEKLLGEWGGHKEGLAEVVGSRSVVILTDAPNTNPNQFPSPSPLTPPPTLDSDDIISWSLYANCLGVTQDIFFPNRGESTRKAREICDNCLVLDHCLTYAVCTNQQVGIWGGLSSRERSRIRKRWIGEGRIPGNPKPEVEGTLDL